MARLYPGARSRGRSGTAAATSSNFERAVSSSPEPTVTRVALPMMTARCRSGYVETWSSEECCTTPWSAAMGRLSTSSAAHGERRVQRLLDRPQQDTADGDGSGPGRQPGVFAGWLWPRPPADTLIQRQQQRQRLSRRRCNDQPDPGGTPVFGGDFLTIADLGTSPLTPNNQAWRGCRTFLPDERLIHDVLYEQHGFDEASQATQTDNFGRGGRGRSSARGSSGRRRHEQRELRAPPDGRSPRMG